jgi:hypothetical protein
VGFESVVEWRFIATLSNQREIDVGMLLAELLIIAGSLLLVFIVNANLPEKLEEPRAQENGTSGGA